MTRTMNVIIFILCLSLSQSTVARCFESFKTSKMVIILNVLLRSSGM